MTYLKNQPYKYPSIDVQHYDAGGVHSGMIDTGWHIFPNFLWRHFATPAQWAHLNINYEAYAVDGMSITLYNPIPITSNISLQRTSLFSAFNNCVYAMMYQDNKYETDWYPWQQVAPVDDLCLAQKEGLTWSGAGTGEGSAGQTVEFAQKKYVPPIYKWRRPQMRTLYENVWSQGREGNAGVYDVYDGNHATAPLPSGVFWDPLNCPEEIGELRAGKNSYTFVWDVNDMDKDKYFNMDQIAAFSMWTTTGPFCGVGRPWQRIRSTNMDPDSAMTFGKAQRTTEENSRDHEKYYQDYTVPNMAYMPLLPTTWFWQEIKNSIIDSDQTPTVNNHVPFYKKADKYWCGTEWEAAKYPPAQMFAKGIPIFDDASERIQTNTQVSVKVSLRLKVKKRRTAYYCPTWGPFSGDQLYSMLPSRLIYQPSMIRYRTGGTRRTWQNVNIPNETNNDVMRHLYQREDPYVLGNETNGQYNALQRPAGIPDTQLEGTPNPNYPVGYSLQPKKQNIRVTFNRDSDEAHIEFVTKPAAPKRTFRLKSPVPMETAEAVSEITHM